MLRIPTCSPIHKSSLKERKGKIQLTEMKRDCMSFKSLSLSFSENLSQRKIDSWGSSALVTTAFIMTGKSFNREAWCSKSPTAVGVESEPEGSKLYPGKSSWWLVWSTRSSSSSTDLLARVRRASSRWAVSVETLPLWGFSLSSWECMAGLREVSPVWRRS